MKGVEVILMQELSQINWDILLIPISIIFIFILLGMFYAWMKRRTPSKEELAEIKDQLNILIKSLPDEFEPIAESAKNLGEYLFDLIVEKGPGLGAGLALRHPEIQKTLTLVLAALLHYCNEHHDEVLELLEDLDTVSKDYFSKDNASPLKIKLS